MAKARTETKSADLATDFGLRYATWLFGEEAIASLPVRKIGKNKGKPKGHVIWLRTVSAGYHPCVDGGVKEGVTVRAWIGSGMFSPESDALQGEWLGRTQSLCGSACFLGPEKRAKWTAERAREAAQFQQQLAELRAEMAAA